MRRVFGSKKDKAPPPSLEETADRINKRGDSLDERIAKMEGDLRKLRDQIKKTRPGPAQEAAKARALRILKQKKLLENQRDQLFNQTFNVEQVAFAADGMRDAQETVNAMKAAQKELKSHMKTFSIDDVDSLQDDMQDILDYTSEIQETLGRSYGVPDDVDEEELMGELDALEADMGTESESVPSYLQEDEEEELAPAPVPAGGGGGYRMPAIPVSAEDHSSSLPSVPSWQQTEAPNPTRAGLRN